MLVLLWGLNADPFDSRQLPTIVNAGPQSSSWLPALTQFQQYIPGADCRVHAKAIATLLANGCDGVEANSELIFSTRLNAGAFANP